MSAAVWVWVQPCSVSKLTRLSGVTGRGSPSSSLSIMIPSLATSACGLLTGAYPFEVQPIRKMASAPLHRLSRRIRA